MFKKWISARLAGQVLLGALALLLGFHGLVLLNVVPSSIVWGGQINGTASNLYVLEGIAIAVTVLFAAIIAAKAGYLRAPQFKLVINIGVWVIFGFLLLNTVGNLASGISAEGLIFAPITLLLAVFALRLALEP